MWQWRNRSSSNLPSLSALSIISQWIYVVCSCLKPSLMPGFLGFGNTISSLCLICLTQFGLPVVLNLCDTALIPFCSFFFYTSYETDSSLYVFLLDYLRPGKKNWDNIDWEKALSSIFNGFVLSYLMKYHKSIHLKCCWETKDLSNMSFIVWIIHIVKIPILSHWSRQSI